MERFFKLSQANTTVGIELGAGLTTFMAMAYIAFVNPQMMASAGMDQEAAFVATCIAAALACFFMGLYANWPVGLAPGMGLNAFFTYTIVGDMGYPWQTALGAVFIAGILFVILTVTRLREWMLISIPWNLRIAMGAGIGLFVGMIGLRNGGLIVDHPATLLSLGNFQVTETLLAALGFLIITGLATRRVPGAILLGILAVTIVGLGVGAVQYQGVVSAPPSIAPVLGQLDIAAALDVAMISAIASILFVNLFDTAGTLVGVATQAGLTRTDGTIENLDRALKADSTSSVAGALVGCAYGLMLIVVFGGLCASDLLCRECGGGRCRRQNRPHRLCGRPAVFSDGLLCAPGQHDSAFRHRGRPALRGATHDVGHAAPLLVRSHRATAGAAHHHYGAAVFLHRKRYRRGIFKLRAAQGDCGEGVGCECRGLGDGAYFYGSICVCVNRRPARTHKA